MLSWGRHLDGVNGGQAVLLLLHKGLQAELAEALPQAQVQAAVALPHGLQALLRRDGQRFSDPIPAAHIAPRIRDNLMDERQGRSLDCCE